MRIALCVTLGVGLCALAALASDLSRASDREWLDYKARFNKSYEDPREDAARRENFLRTKQFIEKYNSEGHSDNLAVNHLADWHESERARLTMQPDTLRSGPSDLVEMNEDPDVIRAKLELEFQLRRSRGSLPAELDLRGQPHRVGKVKDQGQCGSCWAFAAIAVLEGQQVARGFTPELVPLSEQQLIDCDEFNSGCRGGLGQRALYHLGKLRRQVGIQSNASYPYQAWQSDDDKLKCRYDERKAVMRVKGVLRYVNPGQELIKGLLNVYGPVGVSFKVTDTLIHYKQGVFAPLECNGVPADHQVVLVGYGTNLKHEDYWIAKNSWGTEWGDGGYFKIKRGANKCGIESEAFVALV